MSGQVSQFVSACRQRVRRAFVRLLGWLHRPSDPTQSPDRLQPEEPASAGGDSRTHFWAEFRAGQREAAARTTRRAQR